jgi:hypothetical protein
MDKKTSNISEDLHSQVNRISLMSADMINDALLVDKRGNFSATSRLINKLKEIDHELWLMRKAITEKRKAIVEANKAEREKRGDRRRFNKIPDRPSHEGIADDFDASDSPIYK